MKKKTKRSQGKNYSIYQWKHSRDLLPHNVLLVAHRVVRTASASSGGGRPKINTDLRTLKVKAALRIRGTFALFYTARECSRSLSKVES